jgi:UDP-N-acetylmuramoyl-L-alanine---L-glutamate ligase
MSSLVTNSDRIVLWGLGKEGAALLSWIEKQGLGSALVMVVDEKEIDASQQERIRVLAPHAKVVSEPADILLGSASVLLKTPGVSIYHPVITELQSRGCRVESSTSLWLAEDRVTRKIAVTGTKGKSTTSSILAHVLKASGERVLLAGNIGNCPLGFEYSDYDTVVFEASSFQLASLSGSFDYSILLNLQPEHLDWHGTFSRYQADKLGLATRTQKSVVVAKELVPDLGKTAAEIVCYPKEQAFIADLKEELQRVANIPDALLLQHNLENISAVLCLLGLIGVSRATALSALQGFIPLRHRQFFIGEKAGIRYIDDSISTNPLAGMAALAAHQGSDTVMIVGGFDRGLVLDEFADRLASSTLAGIVLLHQTGLRISELLKTRKPGFLVAYAETLESALEQAQGLCPKGGKILLSPAAPSFGLFTNFEQRGQMFARLVGLPYH